MKRSTLFRNILAATLLAAVTSCELDNYDAPDSELSGTILDRETKEPVQQDIIRGTTIKLIEHGYDPVSPQYLRVKNDGTYTNKLLFSNTYTIQPDQRNFIPVDPRDIQITGRTILDFEVVPYIRVKEARIVKKDSKVIATFKLQQNVAELVNKIGLYVHPEPNVGEPLRVLAAEQSIQAVVDEDQIYTLEIDLEANSSVLKPGNDYFFRVGALINVPEAKFNYAPAVRLEI